jgi:dipeptidase E
LDPRIVKTSRRTFLKGLAALAPAAALGRARAASLDSSPIAPTPHTPRPAPAASVLVSGGSITHGATFVDPVRTVHREHYRGRGKVVLVLYASLPGDRDRAEKRLQSMFAADGLEAESLHRFPGARGRDRIASADAFFVSGGETFLLMRTLYDTGQMALLRERVLGGAAYHGTSAGANIAGLLIGCTNDFPVVDIPTRTSLGVFPCVLNPHHPLPGDPEYAGRVVNIRNYLRLNTSDIVLGLANGGSIARRSGNRVSLVAGTGFLYSASGSRRLAPGPVGELSARGVVRA